MPSHSWPVVSVWVASSISRLVAIVLVLRASSLRKIIRAASSCALRAPGRNTQTTTAPKASSMNTSAPAVGEVAQRGVGLHGAHRLASGSKVEKSTSVPSICR